MANKMCLKMAAAGIPVTNTAVSTSGSNFDIPIKVVLFYA